MEVVGSGLLLWRLLAWVCSSRGCSFCPGPVELACLSPTLEEVTGLGLLLQMYLAQACFYRGHWPRPGSMQVSGSGLLPRRLIAQACSFRGHSLVFAPVEVAGLCPLWHRSLDYTCSGGVRWFRIVPGSCLLLRRLLAQACSNGGL